MNNPPSKPFAVVVEAITDLPGNRDVIEVATDLPSLLEDFHSAKARAKDQTAIDGISRVVSLVQTMLQFHT